MSAYAHRAFWLSLVIAVSSGCASPKPLSEAERAADYALTMIGKPYRYGGNDPATGFDCSGLVQWSYARAGVRLSHGTDYLRRQSRSIALGELRRGDLLFFSRPGNSPAHVGIYVGEDRFVHAPSTGKNVYVAALTDSYWKQHFDQARRLALN